MIPALAAAGVGRLTIIDPDQVEMSNLHRQTLYSVADIGQPKALAAAARARVLNPECQAEALMVRLDPANGPGLIAGADLVVDAADSFAVTYTLSDLCLAAGKPLISASVIGRAGYAGGFCGGFGFEDATEAPGFGFVAATQIVATDTVVDLRPAGSVQPLPGAQVLVPGDLADRPIPAGRVVLCCSTGLRAWRGAQVLAARGAKALALLADGQ